LTVAGQSAGTKVYDGTLSAVLTGGSLSGVLAGDAMPTTLTQSGSFLSKNVGTGIGVTASDSLGGTGASNYTLTEPLGLVANITPATLTYTAAAASLTAGQTLTALSGTLSGFMSTDTQANATAGALIWTTTAGAGSQPGHYVVDGAGLTAMNYVFVEAAGNATALTLQAGVPPVVPPIVPPVIPPIVPPVVPPLPGPGTATLVQAQNPVGTLEADLASSQTNIQLVPIDPNITVAQRLDSDAGDASSIVSSNGIVIDRRKVIDAMVPSLRIVRGGVKLPHNLVDVNAR
jgi:hypothetical protein